MKMRVVTILVCTAIALTASLDARAQATDRAVD